MLARLLLFPSFRMNRELRCADVFMGCPHVEQGPDIRSLFARFMAHVREAHGVTSPTPELRIQAMTAVREGHAHAE
jgi:predicted small metal-binding protein